MVQDLKILPGTILSGYVGSTSHGTYIPSEDPDSIDDVDVMSVYIPTIDSYLGMRKIYETDVWKEGKWDAVTYELKKFVGMLLKQNPNIVDLLWLKDYTIKNKCGQMLVDNRDIFSSKLAFNSFVGYARNEIKEMQKDVKFAGRERTILVSKYGYNTRAAAHLIRLMRMCTDFLSTGEYRVDRTGIDADILISIKRGEWSLNRVKDVADSHFKAAETCLADSKLPDTPDYDKANTLVRNILEEHFQIRSINESNK